MAKRVGQRANGCPWNHYTCSKAAQGGHLETFQLARSNGCPWNEDTCKFAAQDGHLDLAKTDDHGIIGRPFTQLRVGS